MGMARHGTRRKRYGRRLHRARAALDKARRRVVALEKTVTHLRARPVGLWPRLVRWWSGAPGGKAEAKGA